MKKIAAALVLIAGVGIAAGGTTHAGEVSLPPDLEVIYEFIDFEDLTAFDAATAATGQLFDSGGSDVTTSSCIDGPVTPATGPAGVAGFVMECFGLTGGATYTLGVDQIGDYYVVDVFCGLDQINEMISDPEATYTQPLQGAQRCAVYLAPKPVLHIDKVVTGSAELVASDFPLEVYDADGLLVETVDPSDELCQFEQLNRPTDGQQRVADDSLCANVPLVPGSYSIGEELPDYGYVARGVECDLEFSFFPGDAQLQAGKSLENPFAIEHSEEAVEGRAPDTICRLTNDFVLQDVSVDLVVINDDGGTAEADEFTIEVFDNVGTLVDTAVDPDPNEGSVIQTFKLPIGDYTFGVSGPDGYTSSAVVTVSAVEPTEIIATNADFTLTENQTVLGVITVDDPPPLPTTTTTTTTLPPPTVPPTTAVPTTVGPTTTITLTLPETGSSSDQTGIIVLMAFGALMLGAGAIIATRRN